MGKSNSFHLSRGATIGLSVAAGILGIVSFGFGMAALAGTMAGLAGVTTAGLTTAATAATTAAFTGAVGGAASVMVSKSQYNDAVKSGVGVKAAKRNLIMSSVGLGLSGLDVIGAGASMYQGVRAAQIAMTAGVLGVGGGIGMGVAQTTQGIQEAQRGTKGAWKDIGMGLASIGMAGVGVYFGAKGAGQYMDMDNGSFDATVYAKQLSAIGKKEYRGDNYKFSEKELKPFLGRYEREGVVGTPSTYNDDYGVPQVRHDFQNLQKSEITALEGIQSKRTVIKTFTNASKESPEFVQTKKGSFDVKRDSKNDVVYSRQEGSIETTKFEQPSIESVMYATRNYKQDLDALPNFKALENAQKKFTMFATRVSVANVGIRVLQSENIFAAQIGVVRAA